MLRARRDYTKQLEDWHAKSARTVFRNGEAEENAFEIWTFARGSKSKARAPAEARCSCPGCEREWPE